MRPSPIICAAAMSVRLNSWKLRVSKIFPSFPVGMSRTAMSPPAAYFRRVGSAEGKVNATRLESARTAPTRPQRVPYCDIYISLDRFLVDLGPARSIRRGSYFANRNRASYAFTSPACGPPSSGWVPTRQPRVNPKWFRPQIRNQPKDESPAFFVPPHDPPLTVKTSSCNDPLRSLSKGVHWHFSLSHDYVASAQLINYIEIKTFLWTLINRSIGHHVESSGNIKANLLQRCLSVTKKGEY